MKTSTEAETDVRTKRWLTVSDLCTWFECGRTTLHRMRTDPSQKFPRPIERRSGGHPRWRREDIEAFDRELSESR